MLTRRPRSGTPSIPSRATYSGARGVLQVVPQTASRYLPQSVAAPLAVFCVGVALLGVALWLARARRRAQGPVRRRWRRWRGCTPKLGSRSRRGSTVREECRRCPGRGGARGWCRARRRRAHLQERGCGTRVRGAAGGVQRRGRLAPGRARPPVIYIGESNVFVRTPHWSAWSASSAQASGELWVNTCTPNCAAGHYRTYRAQVSFWRVAVRNGVRYFSRMRLRYWHGHQRDYVYPLGRPARGGHPGLERRPCLARGRRPVRAGPRRPMPGRPECTGRSPRWDGSGPRRDVPRWSPRDAGAAAHDDLRTCRAASASRTANDDLVAVVPGPGPVLSSPRTRPVWSMT